MKKILLIFSVLLVLFVSSAGAQESASSKYLIPPKQPFSDTYGEWLKQKHSEIPTRYTFLIIPLNSAEIDYTVSMLISFREMYPNRPIPEEFAHILPTAFETWLLSSPLLGLKEKALIPSLLLTMAYQQNYTIKELANGYVILIKPIYRYKKTIGEFLIEQYKKEKNDEVE